MDSSDTSFSTERDERAAFAAKLAVTIAKSEGKRAAGPERNFLSRTFFGEKKGSAATPAIASGGEEAQPPTPDVGAEPALGDVSSVVAEMKPPPPESTAAVSAETAAPAPISARPAPDTSLQEITPPPSTNRPIPAMSPETSASPTGNKPALAQISLGFEITSLQLTPFFKLGAVQLKAVSNVVSLHLITPQAEENPLAASISFEIEQVDLDSAQRFESILLKPLGEVRSLVAPSPKLQIDAVAIAGGGEGAPISITSSEQASTAVQIFGTFSIAAIDFTPAFEIASLRLAPTASTVLLRVAASSNPTALDLPPSFEVEQVQLGDGGQIAGMRISPAAAKTA